MPRLLHVTSIDSKILQSLPKENLPMTREVDKSFYNANMYIKTIVTEGKNKILEAWKNDILNFLDEDKVIVESVQKSYKEKFKLGPPNRLEQRIIHWQEVYKEFLHSSGIYF